MIIKVDGVAATVKLKPGQSCYLYSMGDIGFSGNRHCSESFDDDLAYLAAKKKEGHAVRIFSTGDNLAATSPSERAALVSAKGGAGLYKDTLEKMDQSVIGDCEKFADKLKPFKGDILFIESGHHFYQFSRWSEWYGSNSDQYLARILKCNYGGMVAYLDLEFPAQKSTFRLLAYHGNGNGQLPGSGINRRYKAHQAFLDCDFVFAGHDNSKAATVTSGFRKEADGNPALCEQRTVCIGSHELAYKVGSNADDYVEQAVMRPTPLAGNTMTLFENWRGKIRPRCLI